jgi:hypothetical protein
VPSETKDRVEQETPIIDGEKEEIEYIQSEEEAKNENGDKLLEEEINPFYNPHQMIIGGI